MASQIELYKPPPKKVCFTDVEDHVYHTFEKFFHGQCFVFGNNIQSYGIFYTLYPHLKYCEHRKCDNIKHHWEIACTPCCDQHQKINGLQQQYWFYQKSDRINSFYQQYPTLIYCPYRWECSPLAHVSPCCSNHRHSKAVWILDMNDYQIRQQQQKFIERVTTNHSQTITWAFYQLDQMQYWKKLLFALSRTVLYFDWNDIMSDDFRLLTQEKIRVENVVMYLDEKRDASIADENRKIEITFDMLKDIQYV